MTSSATVGVILVVMVMTSFGPKSSCGSLAKAAKRTQPTADDWRDLRYDDDNDVNNTGDDVRSGDVVNAYDPPEVNSLFFVVADAA